MKLLTVGIAFFIAGVLADKKLTYSCYNKSGGVKKDGHNETKAGGTISDDFADKILDEMKDWSDDKFEAKQNKKNNDLVTIVCKEKAEDKQEALDAIAEQQRIVKEHKDDD